MSSLPNLHPLKAPLPAPSLASMCPGTSGSKSIAILRVSCLLLALPGGVAGMQGQPSTGAYPTSDANSPAFIPPIQATFQSHILSHADSGPKPHDGLSSH